MLKAIILCSILAFSIGITAAGEAEKSPNFGMGVYGSVNIGSQSAPVDTVIDARVADTSVGSTTVQNTGLYGDKPNNRLAISADDGANVDIYVNNVKAGSIIYRVQDAGKLFKLDLNAINGNGNSGSRLSGGSSSGSTGSDSVSKAKGTPNVTTPIPQQPTSIKGSLPGTTAKGPVIPADEPRGFDPTIVAGAVGIIALGALVIYALKKKGKA